MARLRAGKLFGVMEVPEGFVQDIMNGTNTPVRIILPEGAGLESRIFKELQMPAPGRWEPARQESMPAMSFVFWRG